MKDCRPGYTYDFSNYLSWSCFNILFTKKNDLVTYCIYYILHKSHVYQSLIISINYVVKTVIDISVSEPLVHWPQIKLSF